jgi:hypothetical protein
MRNIPRKRLRDYTNEELIEIINDNENVDLYTVSGYLSEILRRMNENSPIFPKEVD